MDPILNCVHCGSEIHKQLYNDPPHYLPNESGNIGFSFARASEPLNSSRLGMDDPALNLSRPLQSILLQNKSVTSRIILQADCLKQARASLKLLEVFIFVFAEVV